MLYSKYIKKLHFYQAEVSYEIHILPILEMACRMKGKQMLPLLTDISLDKK